MPTLQLHSLEEELYTGCNRNQESYSRETEKERKNYQHRHGEISYQTMNDTSQSRYVFQRVQGMRREQQTLVGGDNREQFYQGVQGMGREQQTLVEGMNRE